MERNWNAASVAGSCKGNLISKKGKAMKAKFLPQNLFVVSLRLNDIKQPLCKDSQKPYKKHAAVSRDNQHWQFWIRS